MNNKDNKDNNSLHQLHHLKRVYKHIRTNKLSTLVQEAQERYNRLFVLGAVFSAVLTFGLGALLSYAYFTSEHSSTDNYIQIGQRDKKQTPAPTPPPTPPVTTEKPYDFNKESKIRLVDYRTLNVEPHTYSLWVITVGDLLGGRILEKNKVINPPLKELRQNSVTAQTDKLLLLISGSKMYDNSKSSYNLNNSYVEIFVSGIKKQIIPFTKLRNQQGHFRNAGTYIKRLRGREDMADFTILDLSLYRLSNYKGVITFAVYMDGRYYDSRTVRFTD